MAANAGETKVKLWEGICYPENMRDDWQDEIDDILQVPFAYAVHDIDHDQKSKQRKTHAHVIVVWGGNTTRKAIINVLNRLSADGKKCCSSAEPINNIRHAYDYLIHDTASCRKKGKERAGVFGNRHAVFGGFSLEGFLLVFSHPHLDACFFSPHVAFGTSRFSRIIRLQIAPPRLQTVRNRAAGLPPTENRQL